MRCCSIYESVYKWITYKLICSQYTYVTDIAWCHKRRTKSSRKKKMFYMKHPPRRVSKKFCRSVAWTTTTSAVYRKSIKGDSKRTFWVVKSNSKIENMLRACILLWCWWDRLWGRVSFINSCVPTYRSWLELCKTSIYVPATISKLLCCVCT